VATLPKQAALTYGKDFGHANRYQWTVKSLVTDTRVLVVDDDPDVLAVIEALLGSRGYEVTGAGSAERARGRVAAKLYDILLIDMPMHGLTGIDLAKEAQASGTPVLMIPAGVDVLARIEAAGLPYLLKPFHAADLTRAIDLLVGKPQSATD
jgi:DNA-binding response OmpR family regulator